MPATIAGALPFIAFAALAAVIVHRSGSILPMAAGHAVSNLLTFLVWGDAVRSDARWFRFAWHDQGYTPGGWWGPEQVSTDSHLHVVVDYGSIPEQRVRMVATDDRYQIRDVCNRLKSTVPGLRWFEVQGWDFVNTDRNQARIDHRFLVRYMKARA